MKSFNITYKEKTKYENLGVVRTLKVSIPKPTENIGIDAKAALGVFIANVGSLKKYDIVSIQELSKFGDPIGLPIIPNDNTSIIPEKKRK